MEKSKKLRYNDNKGKLTQEEIFELSESGFYDYLCKQNNDRPSDDEIILTYENGTEELIQEIRSFHDNMAALVMKNKISLRNKFNFTMELLNTENKKEVLPLLVCFICDIDYVFNLKKIIVKEKSKANLARYLRLKEKMETFSEKLRFIKEQEKAYESFIKQVLKKDKADEGEEISNDKREILKNLFMEYVESDIDENHFYGNLEHIHKFSTSTKEKTKLTSDAQFISYDDQLKVYLMVDKDNALYTIDDKGNKDKIISDATIGKIRTGSENKIYFITKNSDLYLKEKDKEKDKIASNVSNCLVTDTSVVFSDNENSLFIKKLGKDKIKLASNVQDFRFNPILNNVAYVSDGALYLKNIEKDEKDKLADKNNLAPFEFASDTALVYMEDYDSTNKKGELFYREIGKDKRKLASDVSSINVFLDGIFYVNSDKTLYFKEYNGDKNIKILDDVTETITSNGCIFVLDKDKNLYKVNANGEKEKINQDVVKYEVTTDSIASTNKEKEIYIGNKKIASDVVDFSVNGKEIAYINNSNEVYMIKDGVTTEKVIDNAKEYKKIQFNDYMLFTNTLGASDILGCWKATNKVNGVEMYFKFNNNNISIFSFKDLEESKQYKIENPTENSMSVDIENENIKIEKIDNDTLKITLINNTYADLKRVSEDEYNKIKSVVDKLLPKAKDKYQQYTSFEGIEEIEGKTYYKYASDEGDIGSIIYFDADGNMFSNRQSKLVPYGTPIETKTTGFTKDSALKYIKEYFLHKDGDDSGINYLVGDLGHEGARSYYRIKPTSIAAVEQGGSGSMGWFKVFEDGYVIED